jgi:uncharacterized protein involved in cysteine biosynthesis
MRSTWSATSPGAWPTARAALRSCSRARACGAGSSSPSWPSLAALAGLLWLAFHYRAAIVGALTPGGSLGDVIGPLLTAVYVIAAPIASIFLFFPVASAISGPFNEELAEEVEAELAGREGPPFSLPRLVRDLALTVVHEARRFWRWLVLGGAVFGGSLLLPGVGPFIALAGGAYVAARFAAWDTLDYTTSRWGWSFAQKTEFLRARRSLALGLGAFVAGLMLVPVVNALALPFGAAGGALLLHDARRRG